jgi:hypothetical protein
MRRKSELRTTQNDMVTSLYESDEKLCVLRPGGGKTIVGLTTIDELLHDEVIRHALVLAPKRVARSVWPGEIKEWEHVKHLKLKVLDGSPSQRLKALYDADKRDVTVLGLDVIGWLVEALNDFPEDHPVFDLLVIDEISRLRNARGAWFKTMKKNVDRWKMIWGLSGTLRPSGPLDLFGPVRLVTRKKLWGNSFDDWRKKHFYPVDYQGYDWQPIPGHEEQLNADIAPWIITAEPPPQDEPTIIFDRIDLPPDARAEYDRMNKKLFATVDDNKEAVIADSRAIAVGKMGQLANGFIYADDTTHRIHEEKRAWLKDLVDEAKTGPVLLIYEFKEDFQMIQEVLGGIPYLGAGVSDKQAERNIQDWNARKLPFMALHPASGGHGLNLQFGGSDMWWMSPTWNPELWEQTLARLARSGQTEQVIVRVCTANHTVDDLKIDRVHYKLSAQQAFEKYLHTVKEAA